MALLTCPWLLSQSQGLACHRRGSQILCPPGTVMVLHCHKHPHAHVSGIVHLCQALEGQQELLCYTRVQHPPETHLPARCQASATGFVLGCVLPSGYLLWLPRLWVCPVAGTLLLSHIYLGIMGHTAPRGSRSSNAHKQQKPFQATAGRSELWVLWAARNLRNFFSLGHVRCTHPARPASKQDTLQKGMGKESHE